MVADNFFVINTNAEHGKAENKQETIYRICKEEGFKPNIILTKSVEEADAVIKNCSSYDRPSRIFIVGGDGTLNRAINSLVPETSSTLYVLPGGTGNDFIRNLTNIKDFDELLVRYLYSSITKDIDVGMINNTKFINITSTGVDSLAASISSKLKGLKGLTYYVSILLALLSYRYPTLDIKIDGEEIEAKKKVSAVAIANGTTYGKGFKIAPHALIDDGKFDIYYVDKIMRFKIAMLVASILNGTHESKCYVHHEMGKEIKLTANIDTIYNVDGEILTIPANEEASFQFAKYKIRMGIPK